MKKILILFILTSITFLNGQTNDILSNTKLQFWGQAHYINSEADNVNDSFLLKRFRIGAKGKLLDELKFAFLYEMAGSSPFLLQGWLDYSLHPLANFRVGQFKYPFGLENSVSATVWDFINPSFVTKSITAKLGLAGGKLRDIGVQFSGKYSFSKNVALDYRLMIMNGNGINTTDNNKNKDFTGRLQLQFTDIGHIGVSVYSGVDNGPLDILRLAQDAYGTEILLKGKVAEQKLKFQSEYIIANYEQVSGEVKPEGYYIQLLSMFLNDKLEPGIRYDSYNPNSDQELKQTRFTIGIAYYLAKKQRISANYEIIEDEFSNQEGNLFTIQFQYAIQ